MGEHAFRNLLLNMFPYEVLGVAAVLMALIVAYIIGSIPFGLILTKIFKKQDLREIGSGNIGATNVLRSGSKPLAFLTLILDAGKACFAIAITSLYALPAILSFCVEIDCEGICTCYPDVVPAQYPISFGLFAIIGHCFPIWLKFKGGKGVATALGVLLAAVPIVGVVACATWLVSAFVFKISSLAALIAIGVAPVVTALVYGPAPAVVCLLIAALVFWRHKENIQRLMNGTEPKIGAK